MYTLQLNDIILTRVDMKSASVRGLSSGQVGFTVARQHH